MNPFLAKFVLDRALSAEGAPNLGLLYTLMGIMVGVAVVGGNP